jgi:SEC-C motif
VISQDGRSVSTQKNLRWFDHRSGRCLFPPLALADGAHKHLFVAIDRLERILIHALPSGQTLGPLNPRFFTYATSMRSLKTTDSVLLLADQGYGEHAMMMARTLIEDAVVCWWCLGQDGSVLGDLHMKHAKGTALHIQAEHADRHHFETLANVDVLPADSLAEFARKDDLTVGIARRLWTGRKIPEMTKDVESFAHPAVNQRLQLLVGLPYLMTNLTLHNSPVSHGATFREGIDHEGQPSPVFSRRPSEQLVRDALVITYRSLALVALAVCENSPNEELDSALLADDSSLGFVDAAMVRQVGRNEPCPCGGGLKTKNCHGRR